MSIIIIIIMLSVKNYLLISWLIYLGFFFIYFFQ